MKRVTFGLLGKRWLRAGFALFILSTLCLARPAGLEPYSLVRVIDGDTIVVTKPGADPEIHVRLVGIDCLESRRIERLEKQAADLGLSEDQALSLGKAATELVEQTLAGKPIYLEIEAGSNDKYGRIIANVWTEDDHQSLNLLLLRKGHAMVYDGGKAFEDQEQFQAAEFSARAEHLGIWAPQAQAETPALSVSRPGRSTPRRNPFPYQLLLVALGVVIIVVGIRMK